MKLEIAKHEGLRRRAERMVARREVLLSQTKAIELECGPIPENFGLG